MFESLVIGAAIVTGVVGIVNAVIMFEVLGRKRGSDFLRSLHRWLGLLFTGILRPCLFTCCPVWLSSLMFP